MKIISFNVNGVRAITKKNFVEDMKKVDADVICLQETKATVEQTKEAVAELKGYHFFGNEADKKGYSGTAILTKTKPISVQVDMGIAKHDAEGRVICAEYIDFYIITVYTPNSGSDLRRLEYRQKWDADFLAYLKKVEKKKPVIVCGDLNVAHKEIDLARPKPNYNKSAGFMQEEIDGMDAYTSNGFVDTFRFKNGDEVKYSWWSYRGGARDKNVGWRIDYFLVSDKIKNVVKESIIFNDIHGSDHCPVGVVV
ncbi:exodeoxyribonuclease III [Crocinitomicaceae bacterium]|jgi:exodeoxyribonuclease-3|nr:exodeoxyribonuclease III [Crocinitomicaceae bacterium]MDC1186598.1 exodeoxyribonuclease III [Crocinitomicaceae bacterium]MDC1194164.1 exodeoxyribonuclease III [Crocinitomicaceae bacterium]MDG2464711.1 exodeoxyribonuclease III [Crocinitomicaceae bacterium]